MPCPRHQKRANLPSLPTPKIRPNRRRSQVGEKEQKCPLFAPAFPIFRPFYPPKWEKPPNRSLGGGTVRARRRNQHQPSRESVSSNRQRATVRRLAGININPVERVFRQPECPCDPAQPYAGININPVERVFPRPRRLVCQMYPSRNQHQPSRESVSFMIAPPHGKHTPPESTSTQSRECF